MKLATLFCTLLLSMTAFAAPSDLQVFKTLTDVGVATDLSPSSDAKILIVDSIQCRNIEGLSECFINDASNYGFQRTVTGVDAKLVTDLLTKIMRASPVFGESDPGQLLVVRGLRCAQSNKEGAALEELTSCYGKVLYAPERESRWGNRLDFEKLLKGK